MIHAIGKPGCVVLSNTRWMTIAFLCVGVGTLCNSLQAVANPSPLFGKPPKPPVADEILILSTRSIGTVCNSATMERRLHCERYTIGPDGRHRWVAVDWHKALGTFSDPRQTFIYVHGNRVASGEDHSRGLKVYHSLHTQGHPGVPVRFIIWSWPSSTIPGPMKDYKVKASRTRPAGWQLAWFLNQFPSKASVAIFGYSYGARITSGAMHLLGGGNLGGLKLNVKPPQQHAAIRIALVAAAFNADWLQPGHYHGRAVSQVERLVLVTNHHDPAMRFFHLSNGRGRVHALGKSGISRPQTLGRLTQRIQTIAMSSTVGRSHVLTDYLAVTSQMRLLWRNLLSGDTPPALESLANTPSSDLAS